MQRRTLCQTFAWLAIAGATVTQVAAQTQTQTQTDRTLALYGVTLKDADAAAFLEAARAAGGVPRDAAPGALPTLDLRGAGVPALQQLTLLAHEGKVARVQFLVKGYGEDNIQLRQLLMGKYGVPTTVSARPMRFGGFADRAAPRGGYQWTFADGMTLVYEHPRIGDVTLSYIDEARLQAIEDANAAVPGTVRPPPPTVRDRF